MFSKKDFGIVSNLIFISMKNFMLSWVEHEKSFITSGPDQSVKSDNWIRVFATHRMHITHYVKGAWQAKKYLRKCAKKRRFSSSRACAKYHPGICSLIHSIVSTTSVCGQLRPWSDCEDCVRAGWSGVFAVRTCFEGIFSQMILEADSEAAQSDMVLPCELIYPENMVSHVVVHVTVLRL